VFSGRKM